MVFQEVFISLWELTPETRQARVIRLLNHSGPVSCELPDSLPAGEEFDRVVSHLALYEDVARRTRLLADFTAFLMSEHRIWLYRTQAPST